MADGGESDAGLDALWANVLDDWNDEQRRARLLEYAARCQRLAEIAGRYRALSTDPEKKDVAQRELDRIVSAATQMLDAMKTARPGQIPWPITLSAFGVCGLLLAWLFFALLNR
jgi:hypothetical protein